MFRDDRRGGKGRKSARKEGRSFGKKVENAKRKGREKLDGGPSPAEFLSSSFFPPRLRIPGPRSRALIRAITPAHVPYHVSALINTRDDDGGEGGGGRGEEEEEREGRQTRQWGGNGYGEARESGTLKQIYRA